MSMALPTQIFRCTYPVPCDTFNCLHRAEWFIGRPDAPLSTAYKVCHKCAESIVNNLPVELQVKHESETEQNEIDHQETTEFSNEVKALLQSKGHKCEECGKTFDTEQGLIIHMTKVHKE